MIAEQLADVRRRIADAAHAAHRDPASVRLIAVSKKQPAAAIAEALAAGHLEFGENYVQELIGKAEMLRHPSESWDPSSPDPQWIPAFAGMTNTASAPATPDRTRDTIECTPIWHFIGHLQRNKLNALLPHVQWIHGVDSLALAQAIAARALHPINALIQINIGDESSKAGIAPDQLIPLLTACAQLTKVTIRGLMCIPPPVDTPDAARPYFSQLRAVRDAANQAGCYPTPLTELSMGMSHDFAEAIAEGATMVRIGTAIFGERKSY